jgi:hypothetical protein
MADSEIWFKTLVNGENALFNKFDLSKDQIPVCLESSLNNKTIKEFAIFRSAFSLYRRCVLTPQEKRCYHEIIRGNHSQKPYFDIDIKLEDDPLYIKLPHSIEEKIEIANNIVEECINSILKTNSKIKRTDILVLSSNSNEKRSYHIIVDRWCFLSASQNREFFDDVLMNIPYNYKKYFDDCMYKSSQQFRIYMSTKVDEDRLLKVDIRNEWKPDEEIDNISLLNKEIFLASLITMTDSCNILPLKIKEQVEQIEQSSKDIESDEYKKILKLFSTFKDKNSFNILDVDENKIYLKRICSSFCENCQRNHDNISPYLFLVNGNVWFNCRRNKKSLIVGNINTIPSISPKSKENIEYTLPIQPIEKVEKIEKIEKVEKTEEIEKTKKEKMEKLKEEKKNKWAKILRINIPDL